MIVAIDSFLWWQNPRIVWNHATNDTVSLPKRIRFAFAAVGSRTENARQVLAAITTHTQLVAMAETLVPSRNGADAVLRLGG